MTPAFVVVTGRELDLTGLRQSIREFVSKVEGADVALFFYAGHGLQANGGNYVIPVDAQLQRDVTPPERSASRWHQRCHRRQTLHWS
ncbi:caspase family protein [Ensifer sp. ENS07]|uniref:caspase family protein n=1 Tax=Ensifer sp. ENS07 TaxID=2769274 RepID=UPI001FEDEC89|nr:caspase family protein [Ensifer sp. ENS07]